MKTLKKITTSGLLLFGISTVLGCVDEPKQKQIELIAHAHSPLEIKKR